MPTHPDSPAFIQYLQNAINELIVPLERIHYYLWKNGESFQSPDTYNAKEKIRCSLSRIELHFANSDGVISESEAAFIKDIDGFLGGLYHPLFTNERLKHLLEQTIEESLLDEIDPEFYQVLSVPGLVKDLKK